MKRPPGSWNPKRRILAAEDAGRRGPSLAALAGRAHYTGNPEHKRNPGDFGLVPPASPRRGKTLCDRVALTRRADALGLLRRGLALGLVDARTAEGDWPGLVWAVTEEGVPLEAQHEGDGRYHGYPLQESDPLAELLRSEWSKRCATA
jgi:hypothetical protein